MGVNTLSTAVDGEIISSSDPNQYKTALTEDLVPRNLAGQPTDAAGSLGSSTYPWWRLYFGQAASGISMREESGSIVFYLGGIKVGEISAAGVFGEFLKDLSVATAKLADVSVTDAKLASNAVTTAKINDLAVTTAKIADSNVTTAKIASGERMTTGNVLGQTAGASVNSVGSYVYAVTSSNISAGGTVLGSNIGYAYIGAVATNSTGGNFRIGESTALSGSWRAMGFTDSGITQCATLFLRIS
jgi:hypothetical protein